MGYPSITNKTMVVKSTLNRAVILIVLPGAVRGLLRSRHLVVKITDFTDFHPILIVFQRYLKKLGFYFTPKRPLSCIDSKSH